MNAEESDRFGNPDVRDAMAALRRAAETARATAIQTAVIVVQDGKRIRVTAEELREQRAAGDP